MFTIWLFRDILILITSGEGMCTVNNFRGRDVYRLFMIFVIVGSFFMTSSCIDYESLDTDELEIIYKKNENPKVLPILCKKYYKKFQDEYIKENFIRNFKNEYRAKTIEYCSLSYEKTGDVTSAKILERLYLSNYVNFHKDFLYFLYWAIKLKNFCYT